MQIGAFFDNRQPQSRAGDCPYIAGPVKELKQVRFVLWRDA